MILRSITLDGIRSYIDETLIPISTGTTLIEGDIAAGKSTILYAIEFALFGLGSFKGTFLLNNKAKRGSVTLLFEADGKEYAVHRTLERKGEKIQQVDCYIKGPEGKNIFASTELKERILQILRFNEPPNARAQSVIYRYAVFTPQEEMKAIILKDPDERLQTLRRAFGIEQYKTAVQNSSAVASKVERRMDHLQGASSNLEELREKLVEEIRRRRELEASLGPLKEREKELRSGSDKEKASLKRLEEAREKMKNAEGRVPLIRSELAGNVEQRDNAKREEDRLEIRIKTEFEPKIAKLRQFTKPTEKSKVDLKEELQKYRNTKQKAENMSSKLEERIANFDSILEKNICPVCERQIEEKDFASKSTHLKVERVTVEKIIASSGTKINEFDALLEALGNYETAQGNLKNLVAQVEDLKATIEGKGNIVKKLDPIIRNLKNQLQAAQEEAKPLETLLATIDLQETRVREAEGALIKVGQDIASSNTKIEGSKENQGQMEGDMKMMEQLRKTKDSLAEHRIWLTEYMSPTIENIELHVMTTLNQRFDIQFQKWFRILMDDADLQVRVDDEFSPIIEREGYEQEYQALSGGERTSVALAYRLALNILVQEVATTGGSNLLILDEPTDGFSKEQLPRVREVLKELNCPQVILVSHETELESFADHVVRIENSNGVSSIHLNVK